MPPQYKAYKHIPNARHLAICKLIITVSLLYKSSCWGCVVCYASLSFPMSSSSSSSSSSLIYRFWVLSIIKWCYFSSIIPNERLCYQKLVLFYALMLHEFSDLHILLHAHHANQSSRMTEMSSDSYSLLVISKETVIWWLEISATSLCRQWIAITSSLRGNASYSGHPDQNLWSSKLHSDKCNFWQTLIKTGYDTL